jgi:hypothetical protein
MNKFREVTGGQAFPDEANDGLTILDYFAAKAMQAFITKSGGAGGTDKKVNSVIAEISYSVAIEMLEAKQIIEIYLMNKARDEAKRDK